MDPEGNWVWLVFNAAMATYDGYQAYKKAKAQGKRGYKLALAVAWAVAGNYIKVGKVYKYLRIAKGTGKVTKGGLNFTKTTAKHMDNPDRRVPIQILQQAIKGKGYKDPRGSNARMYYTIMYRNGKKYNLEVLYDKKTNTILHFEYARKAMGPLKAIPK
ncbi:MAG: hypothetical protein H0Z31_05325 [Bacillus sp. (in: Bacteria)]|jgi:hypothetical protein|nr:hypothetical protein [Bacillus sp. (in: firmicutes)]